MVAGNTNPLTYSAATGRWESTGNNFFSIAPGVGPLPVELKWEERNGSVSGQPCTQRGQQPVPGLVRHRPAFLQRE